jgi:hypothetical protein
MAAAMCLRAPVEKKLFRFFAMVCAILFLREINCGRVLFPVEDMPGEFKTWDEICGEYSSLVRLAYAGFILYTFAYSLKNKLWGGVLARYIRRARIPGWDALLFASSIALGTIGEIFLKNDMCEECFETLFYVSFASIIYTYAYNRDFAIGQADGRQEQPAIPDMP